MTGVFGPGYAADYDVLYGDKDYDAEVARIERVAATLLPGAHSYIDLGCGTGAHATRLAARGHDVTGVDRSSAMLSIAREKMRGIASSRALSFVNGDVRTVRLGQVFDVAIMMFAVLGYQVEDADVRAALRTARAHLAPGGVFVADVWYGPAVLALQPGDRTKRAGGIVRSAHTTLEAGRHVASVEYTLRRTRPGQPDEEEREVHRMRYFFARELEQFLAEAGFVMESLGDFASDVAPASDESWNVLVVARAV